MTIAFFGIGGIGSLMLAVLQAQQKDLTILATDVSSNALATATRLRASHILDGNTTEPVKAILEMTAGRGCHVVVEASGQPLAIKQAIACVRRGGKLLQVGIPTYPANIPMDTLVREEKEVVGTNGMVQATDLARALDLLTCTNLAASIPTTMIDLDNIIEQGLLPLAERRAPGKIVVRITNSGKEKERSMMPAMTLAFDRTLEWNNPDPPYGRYHIPFSVRNGDSWEELQERLARCLPDRLILIADRGFPKVQGERVKQLLNKVAPCSLIVFDGSEQTKHLITVEMLGEAALGDGASRSTIFVALGGGLVGNVCGLLATLFCRGSRFVHMPTTLLAASDSCLSLKQGVNSSWGKNHFGAFYAPLFVWADISFFETLPALEIRAALNECVKNVLAICPQYCQELLELLRGDARYTPAQYARIIDLCVEAKSSLMREDAFEKHRAIRLEYGHTLGHAAELASEGRLPHGIAIGIGMVIEATLSHQLGLLPYTDLQTHYELLRANGAPVAIPAGPQYSTERLMEYLLRDNKRGYLPPAPGKIDIVLLERLGEPHCTGQTELTQVDQEAVVAAIDACRVPRKERAK